MAWATLALSELYGSNITEHDPLCPLAQFIPMPALKSSDNATRKVITHQFQSLKSTCMASLKNIRPLESNIQLPNSTDSITISRLFTSIQDEHNNCLFHAVVPHGHQKDQIMVASTRSNAVHIRAVQQDVLSFLQISYPWLNAEDIFQNVSILPKKFLVVPKLLHAFTTVLNLQQVYASSANHHGVSAQRQL